ncbi:sugar phosphate isomerase/epimerase family protein [Dictyobacter kobayashii]|uniref:Xylose isomerase n=1 Tax=Dictyobacter kobayashii TaxID=2014872 RepID=A0A402AM63_9CHLR|nr:sugar phosphate isomerase/epimerase [Dictyobacter kobayashii]GCE20288.1 xylose isomerase [Dictyobacter kobayashii]
MIAPIALQLYTLRKELAQNFERTITRVAEIGYAGVECGLNTVAVKEDDLRLLQTLALRVAAVHTTLPFDDERQAQLERVAKAGTRHLVISYIPAEEFQSEEKIAQVANKLNAAAQIAHQHGLSLSYHNHWWEFQPTIGGRTPHEILRNQLSNAISFEIDVYWAQTGGTLPAPVVEELSARAPLLHLKDGPAESAEQPMTALGEGKVDIPAVVAASQGNAEWVIVELDACATDMLTAVEKSYHYLVNNHLGHGNQA